MEQDIQAAQRSVPQVATEAAQLVSSIARVLMKEPAEVSVFVSTLANGSFVTLTLAKADYSMVVGQQGRIAKSLRIIINGLARKTGEQVSLEVVCR